MRGEAFVVLGLLPSSESVAVLGGFLDDPEGRDGMDVLGDEIILGDAIPLGPNCRLAYNALSRLGIQDPPTGPSKASIGALDSDFDPIEKWKKWWNEIKQGKRTYQFVGSDVRYGPHGPVRIQDLRENLQHPATSKPKAGEVQPSAGQFSTNVHRLPLILFALTSCLIVALIVWHTARSHRRDR